MLTTAPAPILYMKSKLSERRSSGDPNLVLAREDLPRFWEIKLGRDP
jgi:hypothetical protein